MKQRLITHNGATLNCSQWSKKLGGKSALVKSRLALGWTEEEAVATPARGRIKHNKTGYIGVSTTHGGKFRSMICVDYQWVILGTFNKPESAAMARDRFIKENGLNRKLNFGEES